MQRFKKLLQKSLLVVATLFFYGIGLTACAATNTAAAPADTGLAASPAPETATTSPLPTTEPGKTPTESISHETYVVQPGDILNILVWKEKDLQGEYAVRPDGGLNFPLVGETAAAGKTIEQLKADLAAKLAKYVPDPVVTVTVKQAQGNKIYVVGKVNKPGEFFVNRNVDVMQALSMAGGLNPFASANKIRILRRVNGEQKTFKFKYSQVEKGNNLEQNIVLQGGDIVVVP